MLPCVYHALLPQALKKVTIVHEVRQKAFDLCHDISLICKTHFVSNLRVNDVAGSAKVCDKRHCTNRKSLEYHASAKFADRGKHEHIGSPQPLHGLCVGQHALKRDMAFNPERLRELLKPVPLWAVANDAKMSQSISQETSSPTQCEIASLVRN